ncbi:MAG: hypothetical protein N4A48_00760 [Tepidibacter sp.]|nr:hypothetical protein [Tepidibacter sp.]
MPIEEVSASTEEQLTSIESVTSLTQDLNNLANNLSKSINSFKNRLKNTIFKIILKRYFI